MIDDGELGEVHLIKSATNDMYDPSGEDITLLTAISSSNVLMTFCISFFVAFSKASGRIFSE